MAIGIEVVPTESEDNTLYNSGNPHPNKTPSAIAINIHNVRYLSNHANLPVALLKILPPQ